MRRNLLPWLAPITLGISLALSTGAGKGSGLSAPPAPERLVRDEIGREVRVPCLPGRIVSLAPSVTETLFALGAGDRIVGVTDFCDYPAEARSKSRIGGMVNPNWEAVLSLGPDLLVATTAGNSPDILERAEALHLPLFFLDTPDIESLLESITHLGDLVASTSRARTLREDLAARLLKMKSLGVAHPPPRVLFLVWGDPIMAPGRGTFVDDALRRAGCESVTTDGPPGWPTYDLESILVRNPQWVLATEQNAAFLESLRRKPGWRSLEAVIRGRVATVSPALERPAPRVLLAMEQLREIVGEGRK